MDTDQEEQIAKGFMANLDLADAAMCQQEISSRYLNFFDDKTVGAFTEQDPNEFVRELEKKTNMRHMVETMERNTLVAFNEACGVYRDYQTAAPIDILLLSGKAGAGKSTLANYLVKYKNYTKYSLASPLYEIMRKKNDVFGLPDYKDRPFLQAVGQTLRKTASANREADPIMKKAYNMMASQTKIGKPIVIDDLRLKFEISSFLMFARKMDKKCAIVRVVGREHDEANMSGGSKSHVTEIELDNITFSNVFSNNVALDRKQLDMISDPKKADTKVPLAFIEKNPLEDYAAYVDNFLGTLKLDTFETLNVDPNLVCCVDNVVEKPTIYTPLFYPVYNCVQD